MLALLCDSRLPGAHVGVASYRQYCAMHRVEHRRIASFSMPNRHVPVSSWSGILREFLGRVSGDLVFPSHNLLCHSSLADMDQQRLSPFGAFWGVFRQFCYHSDASVSLNLNWNEEVV